MIECSRLCAGYGKKEVVKDVSFKINPGELTILLGLNGCGKSTLIKAVCGLDDVLSGQINICGTEAFGLNERERAKLLAYIPQRGSFISGQSALDVVLMGYNAKLGLFDHPSAKQREEALSMMNRLEIESLATKDYSELSEGQKQLVILARCLIQATPVMLMDEPDSALDYVNRKKLLVWVDRIVKSESKTCMIALHDPNLALHFADRILTMQNGQITHDFYPGECTNRELEEILQELYGDVKLIESGRSRFLE